jgi:hypothetical protein
MKILKTGIDEPAVMGTPPASFQANQKISTARSTRRQVHDRKSMLDRAIRLVEQARRNGTALNIDAETENLLHENPSCRMSFAELRADFATVASRAPSFLASLGDQR